MAESSTTRACMSLRPPPFASPSLVAPNPVSRSKRSLMQPPKHHTTRGRTRDRLLAHQCIQRYIRRNRHKEPGTLGESAPGAKTDSNLGGRAPKSEGPGK